LLRPSEQPGQHSLVSSRVCVTLPPFPRNIPRSAKRKYQIKATLVQDRFSCYSCPPPSVPRIFFSTLPPSSVSIVFFVHTPLFSLSAFLCPRSLLLVVPPHPVYDSLSLSLFSLSLTHTYPLLGVTLLAVCERGSSQGCKHILWEISFQLCVCVCVCMPPLSFLSLSLSLWGVGEFFHLL